MAKFTYESLAMLGESGITNGTCILLAVMFVYGLWDRRFGRVAPSLMTSLGILGTFCGIYLSLYPLDFTPGNMNNSVTQLLGGMRTAFFTSLAGIGSSIVFRIVERTRTPRNSDDIIKKQMTPEQQLFIEKLEQIRQSIAGEEDSSVVTQLQFIRTEQREAINGLHKLAKTIRKSGRAIAQQLEDSIQDLMSNIEETLIDKFGEEFTELYQAAQAIKEWQEENRDHIEQLTDAFELSAQEIERISENCEAIPDTMASLSDIIEIVDDETSTLQDRLGSFDKLGEQAEKSFPLIKTYLDEIGGTLASSAKGFSNLDKKLQTTLRNAEREIRSIAAKHLKHIDKVAITIVQSMKKESDKSASKMQEIVRKTLEDFGKEITHETNRVARGFGENMLSIAEQCARVIELSGREEDNNG